MMASYAAITARRPPPQAEPPGTPPRRRHAAAMRDAFCRREARLAAMPTLPLSPIFSID